MAIAMCEANTPLVIRAFESTEPTELVRGQDQWLLERVGPVVLNHNVILDLASVERIDAAGITSLLVLYRSAQNAGHTFSVTNASERVAEILAVVGLDGFLLSHNAVRNVKYRSRMERPAA